jgi:hypothetical protein
MKKGKLNPDRYKVIGGAPVEQEANKLSRTRSNKTTKSSVKKVKGSLPKSASRKKTTEISKER